MTNTRLRCLLTAIRANHVSQHPSLQWIKNSLTDVPIFIPLSVFGAKHSMIRLAVGCLLDKQVERNMKTKTQKLVLSTLMLSVVTCAQAFASVPQQSYAIPEPPTFVVGALLLLPLGASALRILRRADSKTSSPPP